MNYFCYSNGKFLRKDAIKVGIGDLVMLRGYGVFDFLRTYNGIPFRLNDYLDRFDGSAMEMKLNIPFRRKKTIDIINKLLKINHASDKKNFGIRLLLTGGYSLDSYLPSVKPNLFILIEDLPDYPEWYSSKGIKLMLYEHKREMPGAKTINYITAIQLAEKRRKLKVQDTLYCCNGKILETTRNNFFLFRGNKLITSKDEILNGITRNTVLEITSKIFKVEVRDVLKKEIHSCSECFVTGTTRGITPVIQIENKKIGNGNPGKNTKELIKMFNEIVNKECK